MHSASKIFRVRCTLVISILLNSSGLIAADEKLATNIADAYLKSFPSEVIKKKGVIKKGKKFQPTQHEVVKLSDIAKRTVVFNEIFANSSVYDLHEEKTAPLLNPYAWADLHFFCGSTTTPGYHLMSRINKTITTLGEGALATLLATPTNNIQEIQQRQQVIQLLMEQDSICAQLKEQL